MIKHNIVKIAMLGALMAAAASASAEVVVVVSASNASSSMTAQQVADIFLGRSNTLKPLDLPESSPLRNEFYQKVTQKEPSQVKAIWSRLIFASKAVPPKEMSSSADVKKALAADPNAIGYIEKSALDSSVKAVLTVD